MNPLLDFLPFETNGAERFAEAIAGLPENQRKKFTQQALHRCISQNYIDEYTTILTHFLPSRSGCGSLLEILIEKERPEMFLNTWHIAQEHKKFHSQLIHIYGHLLKDICHWADLTPIKTLLASPLVGQMDLNDYKYILSGVLSQCARVNNTELFIYLLDQVDHKFVDEYCYWTIIANQNSRAVQAALPYMMESPHPEQLAAHAWEDALSQQNFEIFELMSPIAQPDEIQLCLKGEDHIAFEEYIAHKQAKCIEQHIHTPETSRPARKI